MGRKIIVSILLFSLLLIGTAAVSAQVAAGDIITFGYYEQDNDLSNGPEPIEWQVLSVDDGRALLISRYGLDRKLYNDSYKSVTWETCTLREWLNGEFFTSAFSSDERAQILETTVEDNFSSGTITTKDWIFLLSIKEAKQFFLNDNQRVCAATEYAKANGAWYSRWDDSTCWWLRNPGQGRDYAVMVDGDGWIDIYGELVDTKWVNVRPALYLEIPTEEDLPEISAEPVSDLEMVGSIFTFGTYEQDNDLTNGAEPIEWQVLAVEDGRALVISRYGLDAKPYNRRRADVTWETCTLRKWLNGDFLNSAFSSSEQSQILQVNLQTPNSIHGTKGGNNTIDQIFLLSYNDEVYQYDEVHQFYMDLDTCRCKATAYAIANGANVYEKNDSIAKGYSWWWLRDPGFDSSSAAGFSSDSRFDSRGCSVSYTSGVVRPAFWMDLSVLYTLAQTSEPEPVYWSIPEMVSKEVAVGDFVTIGTYEQDNDLSNGTEPIEWQVLAVEDGRALVISRYGLDAKPYYTENTSITWETCTLRAWLNEEFFNNVFSADEQARIVQVTLPNPDDLGHPTREENDTTDRIFLLSINEVNRYFSDDSARKCTGTTYTRANGGWYGTWWLRSPGLFSSHAAAVEGEGNVYTTGFSVSSTSDVRPAFWLDL